MSRKARSARGELVDIDLLEIKQQLAATPVPVSVNNRRRFIDERDSKRSRARAAAPEALAVAAEAAEQAAAAARPAKRKAPAAGPAE